MYYILSVKCENFILIYLRVDMLYFFNEFLFWVGIFFYLKKYGL